MNYYPWQSAQWKKLQAAIDQNRIPHAMLMVGGQGTGVSQFVDALVAKVLCTGTTTDIACGECKSCVLLQAGNHPDLFRVGPEEEGKAIKVETIRDLIFSIQLSSQYGRYKIAVINPAEAMNRSASNSLLKTLEEPPASSLLILISQQPSLLPVTIRSRCQRINFVTRIDEESTRWLANRLNIEPTKAKDFLLLAQGQPLDAVELAESDILEKQQSLIKDIELLCSRTTDPVSMAKKWLDYGLVDVLLWLLGFVQAMVVLKLSPVASMDDSSGLGNDLHDIANHLDLRQLAGCYDVLLRNYRAASGPFNLNQQGMLEEIIVYWQSLGTVNART